MVGNPEVGNETFSMFRVARDSDGNNPMPTCRVCAKQSATGCPMGPLPSPFYRHTVDLMEAQVFLLPHRPLAGKSHPHFQRRRKERPTRAPEGHPRR